MFRGVRWNSVSPDDMAGNNERMKSESQQSANYLEPQGLRIERMAFYSEFV
jgi:hypothetical protein